MVDSATFAPDWISPPGATIATILDERGLPLGEFARQIGKTAQEVDLLLDGRAAITRDFAQQLAVVLGASETFWTNRETQYRKRLSKLQGEASQQETLEWLQEIPTKDMVKRGWLQPCRDARDLAAASLRFFGVPTVNAWREAYKDVLTVAFRTSKTFPSDPGAVAAWLRQGEIQASLIKCDAWDRDRFHRELTAMRDLTREKDPRVFLPKLIAQCAACGVAVVVLRPPTGCKASGATRFLSSARPFLIFSFRHVSDDHFWFTFFHEGGHLVLHSDKIIFLEGDDKLSNQEESEANEFSATLLVPPEYRDEMFALPVDGRAVIRFARKLGVSSGIIVGQLQHHGKLRRNQLNNLKRSYEWSDD